MSLKQRARKLAKWVVEDRLVRTHVAPETVLLTFDDGPHPEYTPQVLDRLDAHGARGVFFLIGERAEKAPELVREIHGRGHVLGNHTYSHLNDRVGGGYGFGEYLGDIRRCQALIREYTGYETTLFRQPRGEVNLVSLSAALWSRHTSLHWSIEGGEWGARKGEPSSVVCDFVVEHLRPGDILLLHDDNPITLDALDALLPLGDDAARGLRFDVDPGLVALPALGASPASRAAGA